MSFPTQYPIFQFLYWLVNTTGIGGIFVITLAGGMLVAYVRTVIWINRGKQASDRDSFAYPAAAQQNQDRR
jgi:hypothetical protein